jgi:hypothetical protein
MFLNGEYFPIIQVDIPTFYGSYVGFTVENFIAIVEKAQKDFQWSDRYTLKKLIGALGSPVFQEYKKRFHDRYIFLLDVIDFLREKYSEVCIFSVLELNIFNS